MRRAICTLVLLLGAATAAAAQGTPARDTIPARRDSTAAADSAAAADSIAAVRELEAQQTGAPAPTSTDNGANTAPVQRLLPDISVVGDFVGDLSPEGSTQEGGDRLGIREIEIAAQAAVDPYFRGDVFLGINDREGISIEQAYLTATALPYALDGRIGRFLMPFGKQNTTHRHDLHTVEYPWVIQRFLGGEGEKGTGIYLARVFSPFGFYQELIGTVVDHLGEPLEGLTTAEPVNRHLGGLGYSARLRNYVDISQASNFELSFSAQTGRRAQPLQGATDPAVNAIALRQTTLGADFTFRWKPLQQGLYKSVLVQAEVMHQTNENHPRAVIDRDYTGGYALARYQLTQRTFVGARYDRLQDPQAGGGTLSAGSGYLEFFPSEFSKLTAMYERYSPSGADALNRILLQATFALGPHKPHPF